MEEFIKIVALWVVALCSLVWDTTILEKHSTYEGLGPRQGVTICLSFHGKLDIYCFRNPRSNSAFLIYGIRLFLVHFKLPV
jgi:hypothetical protein